MDATVKSQATTIESLSKSITDLKAQTSTDKDNQAKTNEILKNPETIPVWVVIL